jgi:hypothetical protein
VEGIAASLGRNSRRCRPSVVAGTLNRKALEYLTSADDELSETFEQLIVDFRGITLIAW